MKNDQFSGLMAGAVSPLNQAGDLCLALVEKQAHALIKQGVSGVFVNGTTGEWPSLTFNERLQIAQRWIEVVGKSMRVVVNVGSGCQRESVELAVKASNEGAWGVASNAPLYFQVASAKELVEFYCPVAEAARGVRFYHYQSPSASCSNISVLEICRESKGRISNLAGVKWAGADITDLDACVALDDHRYEMLYGREDTLIAALALGVRAAVGSTFQFMSSVYLEIIKAFELQDVAAAQAAQLRAGKIVALINRQGGLAAVKDVLRHCGLDCGPMRSPMRPLPTASVLSLCQGLEALGVHRNCLRD